MLSDGCRDGKAAGPSGDGSAQEISLRTPLASCGLCPRRCGVNRLDGRKGYCGAGSRVQVYRYGPHHGEEPPVSGAAGSGTVFFGRCTLRCLYCQNYPWSQGKAAEERTVGVDGLADIFRALHEGGCHNWNLVSPTPWLPMIRDAVGQVKKDGVSLPVVYNTSGYERAETLAEYAGLAQVYLADLRYSRAATAAEGSDAADYVETARAALLEMWRQAGPLEVDEAGIARTGTICRLLILPGRAGEAVENLEWLAANTGTRIAISVMVQYVPAHRADAVGAPWNRRILRAEYDGVCEAVERLGFSVGWQQDLDGERPGGIAGFEMSEGAGSVGMPATSACVEG